VLFWSYDLELILGSVNQFMGSFLGYISALYIGAVGPNLDRIYIRENGALFWSYDLEFILGSVNQFMGSFLGYNIGGLELCCNRNFSSQSVYTRFSN